MGDLPFIREPNCGRGISVRFIIGDVGLVAEIAYRVAVMRRCEVV